jgi:hypothetical protein
MEQDVKASNGDKVRCEGEVDDDGVVGSRRGTRRTGRGAGLWWTPRRDVGWSPTRAGARNGHEAEVRRSEEYFQVWTLTARPLDLHPMIKNQ